MEVKNIYSIFSRVSTKIPTGDSKHNEWWRWR